MSIRVQEYFDGISASWDGWQDIEVQAGQLADGLMESAVGKNETVLDLGCGTGNLTLALLKHLSPAGAVISVDFSPKMLAVAREKTDDPRVRWIEADASRLPLPDDSVDRVICFSAWPHFREPLAAVQEIFRVMHPGGTLHIWHLSGRDIINHIHTEAGGPIRDHLLPPAADVARLLQDQGFLVVNTTDEAGKYLVIARKSTGLT